MFQRRTKCLNIEWLLPDILRSPYQVSQYWPSLSAHAIAFRFFIVRNPLSVLSVVDQKKSIFSLRFSVILAGLNKGKGARRSHSY